MELGDGYYFYAYAHPDGQGVQPSNYARFINETIKQEIPPIPPIPVKSSWIWKVTLGGLAASLVLYLLLKGGSEK
jgi:hypothetical protein